MKKVEITEEEAQVFGEELIKALGLKLKKNNRIDMAGGDKTPIGLGRTIIRMLNDSRRPEILAKDI